MKKIISLLTLCAVLVFPASAFASEDNNSNLTKEEIRIQYDQIMEKYQVNEPFSDEDAAFIFEYADELGAQKLNDESTITPFASERKSFQGANGTRNITGFITYDNTLVTNSWRLYMTAWDTTQIKRDITTSVGIDVFGLIDLETGKVGKVHATTVSQKSSGKVANMTMDKSHAYAGYALLVVYTPKATFDGVDVQATFQ